MLTVADMAEGGVKNGQKSADILYGRSQSVTCSANHLEMEIIEYKEFLSLKKDVANSEI